MRKIMQRSWIVSVCFLTTVSVARAEERAATALRVFEQRILPIFRSSEPSSCVQCHLSSVDLKNYILPSSEKTFLSLRDQGLIDLESPRKSRILALIRMGQKDPDPGARLIHEDQRGAEYEAFAAWIDACCRDPRLIALPALTIEERARPAAADEVIRHARKSRLVDSFVRNVWSQRMRCFPCHTHHEVDPENPRHQAALKTLAEFKEKYPAEVVARLNIFRETPEATLQYLIDSSRNVPEGQAPLIDLQNPQRSLLVLKPMSKLPPKDQQGNLQVPPPGDPMAHLGGLKMHADDHSYKAFISWLQDYANVVEGRYTSVAGLPADNWQPTQLVIKLTDIPANWPEDGPVQIFVHQRPEQGTDWNSQPEGFTQGRITPKRMVHGTLFLLDRIPASKDEDSSGSATLPRGDYLVKIYQDRSGRLSADPSVLLDKEDFVGSVVLERARWREGFRSAETVSARSLSR